MSSVICRVDDYFSDLINKTDIKAETCLSKHVYAFNEERIENVNLRRNLFI
jgi:hypothetical protein